MDILQANNIRELRAAILGFVYDNHRKQKSRLRLGGLATALTMVFFDVDLNDLIAVLDDLKERGCLTFTKLKDKWSGEIRVGEIMITPHGRDLVERSANDPGVNFD